MKKILLLIVLSTFVACNQSKKTEKEALITEQSEPVKNKLNIEGDYVSEGYTQRGEGYDWTAVSIVAQPNEQFKAVVSSRADKKKPTCSFEGILTRKTDNIFVYNHEGVEILFTFDNEKVEISTEQEHLALHYFCSGGGTLAGAYTKINEDLDKTQLQKH